MEELKMSIEKTILVPTCKKKFPAMPLENFKEDPKFLKAEDFKSHHMVTYPEEVPVRGYCSIDVLEFLNGKKWDEVALAYVHALRPSCIRVTTGCCTLDARTWRVTVFVDENDIIKSIEQEVEVALPEKVNSGWMLREVLEYGIDSDVAKWHMLESDNNMICSGVFGTYKTVNGKIVQHPLSQPDEGIEELFEAAGVEDE